jgi:hypothetical protein
MAGGKLNPQTEDDKSDVLDFYRNVSIKHVQRSIISFWDY